MLLQKLREYSDRLDAPPTLYAEGSVRYVIELDARGRLLNPRPTDTADPSSASTRRGTRRLVPQVQRASGLKPLLLADKADYVLGYGHSERAARCHDAFMEMLRRCATETKESSVLAVERFLTDDPLSKLNLGDEFDAGGIITFRVDGIFPVDLPAVQEFWATENDPGRRSAPVMQCLVCGKERPVLTRLQEKIKGVPGGQTAGTSLISANKDAFESYGLEASLVAPTCQECGERFTKAANALLSDERSRIRLANSAFVFWTREQDPGFDFGSLISDPKPEDVQRLLESVRTGRKAARVEEERFYATALSGSGGRAVVRDWIDTTIGEVKQNLVGPNGWFSRQSIVGPYGEEPLPLGLYSLAGATVREMRDLPPPTPRAMLRSALLGSPLPPGLLHRTVVRCKVGEKQPNGRRVFVTRPQAALIKLVLLSQRPAQEEGEMVQLDAENTNRAYLCGRLLFVLEAAQRAALPGVKATIVDRFFGTASSAPMSVFGRLVRGAQPHLAKLERDRPGAFIALQQRIEEIMGKLPPPPGGFPRMLTQEEQAVFALGYYHQRAYDRAQARAAKERRETGPESQLAEVIEEAEETSDKEEK